MSVARWSWLAASLCAGRLGHRSARLACALAMVGVTAAPVRLALALEPALAPEAKRITDRAIFLDGEVYRQTEQRLEAQNARGSRVADYAMAKAQCWVDVSYHEYTSNDRSDFPEAALREAEDIIAGLEAGPAGAKPGNDAHQTPLINGAVRLRGDLWDRLAALEAAPTLQCAAAQVACAEVELVHAGSEYAQFGWRQASPYVGMAEDLVNEAEAGARTCPSAPPTSGAGGARGASGEATRVLTLATDALFAFGRSDLAGISPDGRAALEALTLRLQHLGPLEGIAVVGYTDRIDAHHDPRDNQRLSEARAASVAAYLKKAGFGAVPITSSGRGASDALVDCPDRSAHSRHALYACLAPNRRVEIVVTQAKSR